MTLDRSTIWPYDERGEPQEFFYQRYGHPAGVEVERALGELDGGHALLFASGMGATTALALALLGPGASIAVGAGAYFGTARGLRTFERWGVTVVEFDQKGAPPADADVVWLAAPSSSTRRSRRRSTFARSSAGPTTCSTRRRNICPATTTSCSAASSASARRMRRR